MLNAGSKGSGVNDLIWTGDVVNEASNLCHEGNRGYRHPVQISSVIRSNLKEEYAKLFGPVSDPNGHIDHYEGNVVNVAMNDYLNELKAMYEKNKNNFASLFSLK